MSTQDPGSPSSVPHKVLSTWEEVVEAFDELKPPRFVVDDDGDGYEDGWVFRGHGETEYTLEPTIEREFGRDAWSSTEPRLAHDFQAHAPSFLPAADIPRLDQTFEWLALMQHYGVPTRLLDFTRSPYVALYFAVRGRGAGRKCSGIDAQLSSAPAHSSTAGEERPARTGHRDTIAACHERPVDIWAMQSGQIYKASVAVSAEMSKLERSSNCGPGSKPSSLDPSEFAPPSEAARSQSNHQRRLIERAVSPERCYEHNKTGFVVIGSPFRHNRRLASQQGVFLINGAEGRTLQESLDLMMSKRPVRWRERFRIMPVALRGVEDRLFHMNIHELSLFPDIEGLAGYIRQRARLGM